MSRVTMNGKPFSGVTYNQGSFTGNRGHIFINGYIQCSYGLNVSARSRIWEKIETVKVLSQLVETDEICKVCAKKTKELIKQKGTP